MWRGGGSVGSRCRRDISLFYVSLDVVIVEENSYSVDGR